MQYFEEESGKRVHTAAVCVYPSRVKDAYEKLSRLCKLDEINIAAGKSYSSISFTFNDLIQLPSRHWISIWTIPA